MAILESPSACIAAEEGVIAKAVLMPGDPLRAKFVAEHYLENPVCFNTVRNMLGYTGIYKGRKLSVMGHGMGVPSAGLYAHELYNFYGVDTIIRIGSAGGIGEDVKVRDVVLAMGASTNSHFADQYRFPGQLCATADYGLLKDAAAAAERLGVRADVGQVFTSDQFYNDNPEANATYRKFGILAVEMETAGIYWTAQRFGKRALSILTISDHIFTGEALSAQERQDSFHESAVVLLKRISRDILYIKLSRALHPVFFMLRVADISCHPGPVLLAFRLDPSVDPAAVHQVREIHAGELLDLTF